MDIDYDTVNRGGTYMYAPYPAGGNYFNDYNGIDEYSGPDQDIPGSDGIIDEPREDNDHYAFVEQDGWKYTDIEPTLIVLGGFDWRVLAPYWMEPGESRSYQFYILNGGNSAPVRWGIEEIPEYSSWEFEEISGSVEPSDGMVRIPFVVTAPDEVDTRFYGTIKIVNEDNPDNYFVLQADLRTPIIHPFVLFMERLYDFFEQVLDYFQVIITNI